MKKYSPAPVIFMLVVCILVNGLSLSFRGEVFAHELDHASLAKEGIDLDAATHLCLHSAGQYQPFFFHSLPQVFQQVVAKTEIFFVSSVLPEIIPDPFLRPPSSV